MRPEVTPEEVEEEHVTPRTFMTSLSSTYVEQTVAKGTEAESSLFGCNCGDPSCEINAACVEAKMAALSVAPSARSQSAQRGALSERSNVDTASSGKPSAPGRTKLAPSFMPWASQSQPNENHSKSSRNSSTGSERLKPWLFAYSHQLPELVSFSDLNFQLVLPELSVSI